MIGKVKISGTERDSAEDVLKYIDVHPGAIYDSDLCERIEHRLWESGRYLAIQVDKRYALPDANRERISGQAVLRIKLREYRDAPPLAMDFSSAEQALLKLREWLPRWARGEVEEDIVVTAEVPPAALRDFWPELKGLLPEPWKALAEKLADTHVSFRMILGPNRGQAVKLTAAHGGEIPFLDMVFVTYPDRLILSDLQRKVKLVMPLSAKTRLELDVSGKSADENDLARKEEQPFEQASASSSVRRRFLPPSKSRQNTLATSSPSCMTNRHTRIWPMESAIFRATISR